MQDDLVVIPTYDRPELLWLCLERIAASPDHQSVNIRVYVDAHVDQPPPPRADIEAVLRKFPQLKLKVKFVTPHPFHGNSYNVLMAYKEAYEHPVPHVFMVEDDILVEPGFFAWHRQRQAEAELDCSIGVGKRPEHAHYASLGVCFRREVIAKILPHCRTEYFSNMRMYCRSRFAPTKIDCEQDGLWCRVLSPQLIAWPEIPVAHHVGWYGYHRKKSVRPTGTLEQRYKQVKLVLANHFLLQQYSRDFGDVHPILTL